jgi:hypothetical protein
VQAFTPIEAVTGGVLIGLAAVLLMLAQGRIAGISGIVSGLLPGSEATREDVGWRVAFVVGLIGGPILMRLLGWQLPDISIDASVPLVLVAGFLVGFGARTGSGCTSGHGVCGLARGSRRSMVATVTFMLTAVAVVFIVRHGIGA